MFTKSLIQQQMEVIEERTNFEAQLNELLEAYNVEDSIFHQTSKGMEELTNGYFCEKSKFETLHEAIREMTNNQAIRIIENQEFILGDIHYSLTNCMDSEKVYDVEFSENIR